jgi:hypothetical protein
MLSNMHWTQAAMVMGTEMSMETSTVMAAAMVRAVAKAWVSTSIQSAVAPMAGRTEFILFAFEHHWHRKLDHPTD